ncbi:MAG: AmmeMemoRadiSam system protein B [Ignavibacteria bacterium]|nr:AmmeMemoRadiSam system protein B [Ignavibacteria bacterium]
MFAQDAPSEKDISYRPPTVAGSFYPSDPEALRKDIEAYLEIDKPQTIPPNQKILGIISPHAGYIYSGFVAGKVYKELSNRNIKTAIVISPSHHHYFQYASVFSGDAYVTPFGPVQVDKELSLYLSKQNSYVRLSIDGHNWRKGNPEHSLEVQIPFLQYLFPNIKIVPIVMGSQDPQIIHSLTLAIINTLKDTKRTDDIVLVASSDLSHYHSYKVAYEIDSNFITTFQNFDYFKLIASLNGREIEACGLGPIAVVMCVSEALGANKPVKLLYATSGDSPFVTPMKERVVGYFAGALVQDENYQPKYLPELSQTEKEQLLDFVKKVIFSVVNGEKFDIPDALKQSSSFLQNYTAFVTIEKNDELRACMGHIFPTKPLVYELQEVAKTSATSDWRFGPVRKEELPHLSFEITILSRFKKVFSFNEIVIGKHGLYLRYKNYSGLLLPQVATERNWDVTTFLQNLCLKAGVSKTTFLDPEAEIYSFEALIIH